MLTDLQELEDLANAVTHELDNLKRSNKNRAKAYVEVEEQTGTSSGVDWTLPAYYRAYGGISSSSKTPSDASNAHKNKVENTILDDASLARVLGVSDAKLTTMDDRAVQQTLEQRGLLHVVTWDHGTEDGDSHKKTTYKTNRPASDNGKKIRPIPRMRMTILKCAFPERREATPFDQGTYDRLKRYALGNKGVSPKVIALMENIIHCRTKPIPSEAELKSAGMWESLLATCGRTVLCISQYSDENDEIDETYDLRSNAMKHFIFCGNNPAYGTELVRDALLCAGFEDCFPQLASLSRSAKKPKYKEPIPFNGFVVLPSNLDQDLLAEMIGDGDSIFNSEANAYGKMCRIVVADSKYAQGISLFNVRVVHMFDMTPSLPMQRQAIARAVRSCGHRSLSGPDSQGANQWYVDVLRYASSDPSGRYLLTEGELLETSTFTAKKFDAYLDALREVAIDAGFYNY